VVYNIRRGQKMSFWVSFFAGIAAGIVIAIFTIIIRHYFKRPENSVPLRFDKRTLGMITMGSIAIVSVAAIVYLAVTGKEIPSIIYSMFVMSILFFYFLV
jgi:hypothetical protein